MKVLFATSEIAPWVKTGGLGDISAALPPALRTLDIDIRVLVPAYPALLAAFPEAHVVADLPPVAQLPGARLKLAATPEGVPLYLLECPALYGRSGNPYLGPEGIDWLDNVIRFGLLSHTAALLGTHQSPLDWHPDVLHCNDWQSALAVAYLHYVYPAQASAASVVTIHNLAFQGLFGKEMLPDLGLPAHAWAIDGVEYHGHLSFLKAGLQHATAITTVSPTYAREIQTLTEGMGMDGLLRYRAVSLTGIVNGIDTVQWNPATDPHLVANYDSVRLKAKAANTVALRKELGLVSDPSVPLLGIVSRFTRQKGLDLLIPLAARLAQLPVHLAVLGGGDRDLEVAFLGLAHEHTGQFALRVGFDEGLAHRIEAGADLFVMPSRFEPCGLNQLYSLRYGTPPIVRATGGLADTVIDVNDAKNANGFVFQEATAEALLAAIERAVALWHDKPAFFALMKRGMAADYSWARPARATADVYRSALER